jgi:Ca2+-binding RTX toxin-like protein
MPTLGALALSTGSFLSGVGVDTHIPYTDGGYANISNVLSDLQYLGVHTVRDGITDGENGSAPLSSYIALAKAGVQFTFIVVASSDADLSRQLGLIDQVQTAAPGSVLAVEGPNEINNQPLTFDGVSGLQGALNLQAALYKAVHADPALAGVRVDYFTGYDAGAIATGPDPVAAGLADYDNQHPYPQAGQAPAGWVSRSMALPNTTAAGEPAVYTETGYTTAANGVSPDVQAKYTLDLLFDTAGQTISRTYLYQLMDAYAPGSPQGDDGYGLFDDAQAAKPAAMAIHDLTTILGADGAASGSALGQLGYSVTGLDSTGHSLVLQKADGAYDVVIWAEPQIWNASAHQEIAASAQTATLSLSQAVGGYAIYDPLSGTAPIGSGGQTSSISVAVTDHPVIVELTGAAAATSSAAAPAQLIGTAGADVLVGPDGQSNYIRGGDGADSILGGSGFNNVNGNQGDDTIVGRSAVGDWLVGGQGNDSITATGSSAHNILAGNLGDDTLHAGSGGDSLRGGQGDDSLLGGAGSDWLSGDRGHDTLTGGGGADIFHTAPGMGVSYVTDFSLAQGDRVQLDPSSHPTLSQSGADVVIDLGGGTQMILQNTSLASLQNASGWLVYA